MYLLEGIEALHEALGVALTPEHVELAAVRNQHGIGPRVSSYDIMKVVLCDSPQQTTLLQIGPTGFQRKHSCIRPNKK